MSAGRLSGQGELIAYAEQVTIYWTPQPLSPGAPLNGGGVGGTMLWTWTYPPQVVFAGWVPTGQTWQTPPQWAGTQLQAYYPTGDALPYYAGPEPEGGGTFTIVRVVAPGGWPSDS
jgi:hypothetical protein